MQGINELAFFMVTVGVIALSLAVYFSISYMMRLRKTQQGRGTTEVGFVVDTFHELVAALKEKERELEALRKKAEEKADIIEDYNENILQSVPSGVVSLDEAGRVVKMNASAQRILGVILSNAIGKDASEVLRDFPLGEGSVHRHYVTPSGKRLWLALSSTPLMDTAGITIGSLLVFTDLTELKALEAQAELRNRLSSLGEMAAGIAHELRNSMGVISGYMRILSKGADPSTLETVKSVSKEVDAMESIINGFLSFARPPVPNKGDVDLRRLVLECLRGVAGEGSGIETEVLIEEGMRIKADELMLKQAFTNIIRNSFEALGGQGLISVRAIREGDFVNMEFSDTGHGIPEGIREKIFLPFYTTKQKGTGLGLAITHSIITNHGGSIDATSTEEGTTFRIGLPDDPEREGRQG